MVDLVETGCFQTRTARSYRIIDKQTELLL